MIGIDIVEIARIGNALERHGDRFLEKVFTPSEIAYARKRKRVEESLAGRFAAKEAFIKAIGRRPAWKEIEVLSDSGKPFIIFQGKRYEGVSNSHERSYAVSVVLCKDFEKGVGT